MLSGLYSAASGMQASERTHEVIAENLAHANVPGYRGQYVLTRQFEDVLRGTIDTSSTGHGSNVAEVMTDFTPGPTAQTGRSLDVAIGGEGFFEVAGPNGPLYTRNGVFQVNENRELVTSDGLVIQGTGGPISVPDDATTEELHISSDGSVNFRQTNLGQLRVVTFPDQTQLRRDGTTLFSAPPAQTPTPSTARILQGVREMSNVSAVSEMVRMVWGMRHYEAAQKAISTMDEAISKSTNPQS